MQGAKCIILFPPSTRRRAKSHIPPSVPGACPPLLWLGSLGPFPLNCFLASQLMGSGNRYQGPLEGFSKTWGNHIDLGKHSFIHVTSQPLLGLAILNWERHALWSLPSLHCLPRGSCWKERGTYCIASHPSAVCTEHIPMLMSCLWQALLLANIAYTRSQLSNRSVIIMDFFLIFHNGSFNLRMNRHRKCHSHHALIT